MKLDRLAVATNPVRDPLVADGDVQKPVHPQADPRRDVVVDPVEPRQLGPEPRDEIHTRVGLAVAIRIAKCGKKWGMNDVERPVDPLQSHHAPELVGENRGLSVLDRHHAIDRFGRRPGHVHRVGADVDRPVRRGHDRGRKDNLGRLSNQLDRPALWTRRAAAGRADRRRQRQR